MDEGTAVGALLGGTLFVFVLLWLAMAAVVIAGWWKMFVKAGKPGWAAIVPIYNMLILLEIAGRPGWWFLLMLIPLLNIVIAIIVCIDLAKSYGQSAAFGIGIALLGVVFIPILGFGSARYQGPAALTQAVATA